MTKERESQIAECKELLIRLERWIAADKFLRHQNGSIEVEYVLCSILNLVYGWQLDNANDLFGRSQDSFDLSDEQNSIAVQVTITDSAEKIHQTLRKFIGKYDQRFNRLVFVYPMISPAESRADFSRDLNGFDFDSTRDRLGLGTILSAAQASLLLPLRNLLRKQLGTLAAPLDQQFQNVVIANTVIAKHGIQMRMPGETRARADLPTMILSAYARPLPDNLPSVPRYPSPSWAGESEFTVLPLFYASERDGAQINFAPVNPYLEAIHDGGPVHTLTADPWFDVFHFPTFDVKLVNNTDKTIFFHEAEFRVATSKPDFRALPAVRGPLGSLYVCFANLGWGEIRNATLRFALAAIPEEQLDEAPLRLPEHLPHRIQLGTFDSSKTFTLLPFFQIEDVDPNRLADLLDIYWGDSDESKVRFNREMEFCYESADSTQEQRFVQTRELPREDYEHFLQRAAGRFYRSRPYLAGVLDYDETSRDGSIIHRSVSVFAVLDFARYGFGAAAPASNEYHIKLDVDGYDYVRTLQISHALRAGEADRFLIQVAADQSSFHDLTFALRFNNDEVVEAPVHLELFCSPRDAHFASSREFSQP